MTNGNNFKFMIILTTNTWTVHNQQTWYILAHRYVETKIQNPFIVPLLVPHQNNKGFAYRRKAVFKMRESYGDFLVFENE